MALSADSPKTQLLPEHGAAWVVPFTVRDVLPDEPPPIRQDPSNLPQTPDTLALLLERIRVLEAAKDSARAVIAHLEGAVAGAVDEIAGERSARADAIDELLRSLLVLVDSTSISVASDARTRLEDGLRSVRASAERDQATLRAQADGIVRELGDVRVLIDEQGASLHDSFGYFSGTAPRRAPAAAIRR